MNERLRLSKTLGWQSRSLSEIQGAAQRERQIGASTYTPDPQRLTEIFPMMWQSPAARKIHETEYALDRVGPESRDMRETLRKRPAIPS